MPAFASGNGNAEIAKALGRTSKVRSTCLMFGWVVMWCDSDSNRVKSTAGGVTTAHAGTYFEWTGSTSTMKKYYSAGGARVAVRTGSSTLNFILTDHLGSTSVTTDSNGATPVTQLYNAWGESRYASGTLPTRFTYTGQYSNVADFGLMYYGARWYDSTLGRFGQADTIVPGAGNPMAWDRYAYGLNSPINWTKCTSPDISYRVGKLGSKNQRQASW